MQKQHSKTTIKPLQKRVIEIETTNSAEGKCPKCHTPIENWGSEYVMDDTLFYEFTCDNCGLDARECHEFFFVGYDIEF